MVGIKPDKKQSTSTCHHCITPTDRVHPIGLKDLTTNSAIEFWGGISSNKIVCSPCRGGDLNSFYCFFATEQSNHHTENWRETATVKQLLAAFLGLDPDILALFANFTDSKPWRLLVHQGCPHWQAGRACVMGDVAHPMMLD
jgi:salicylate hydroxylase